MHDTNVASDLGRIAQDLQIRKVQVESVVQLLDEGNTIPFITRYRKERTGGLDEELIRIIQRRVQHQRGLAERKQTILKNIQAQGKLTEELQKAILAADTPKRLEDLYLPFKPKKRSLAAAAREKGLEPLALAIWNRDPIAANLAELLPTMVNPEKELPTPEAVRDGVQHILAEQIAETADIREAARRVLWETGKLTSVKTETVPEGQGLEFKDYFQFTEPVRQMPPHRILALNRGEKQNVVKVKLEFNQPGLEQAVLSRLPLAEHPHADFLRVCAADAMQRLMLPSLEREIRRDLTERAEDHAIDVFSRNLRRLLLQPPIRGQRVLALDPGFRTGCKVAILDEIGNLLEHGVIHPHQGQPRREEKRTEKHEAKPVEPAVAAPEKPGSTDGQSVPPASAEVSASADGQSAPPISADAAPPTDSQAAMPAPPAEALPVATADTPPAPEPPPAPIVVEAPAPPAPAPTPQRDRREESKKYLEELARKHQVTVIAIGNGTACRETEELVASLIEQRLPEMAYVVVNEAGASHYSTGGVGREEFPDLDATVRGTISIGRRLQDPLSELVKIEPQNIGVGLYQHDLSEKRLKESLEGVIESCVNQVGVDLNTASVPLLRHVSGLNQLTARNLVDHRKQHGPFRNREQLKEVPGVGEATFTQSAGFLKILGGDNPLDASWIHPESYGVTQWLMAQLGYPLEALGKGTADEELKAKLSALSAPEVCKQLNIGAPTFQDIIDTLLRPGRDPREELPTPIFRKGVLKLEDLQPGMELKGTVLNVVDFGAFVDVGLKDSGLVHISQLANRFIRSPYEVVAVGDVVMVWVLKVDHERHRVSLTMIKPGTERKPPERREREQPRRGGHEQQQQGQQQGQGQGQRGQDRRPPPRRGQRPQQARPAAAAAQGAAQAGQSVQGAQGQDQGATQEVAATTQHQQHQHRRQPPPRRQQQFQQRRSYQSPRREPIKPVLTEEALEGSAPLRTFAELKAFLDAKKEE